MQWNFASSSLVLVAFVAVSPLPALAQSTRTQPPPAPARPAPAPTAAAKSTPAPPVVPKDYVIGVDDVLSVVFFREKDMSAEVVVRPDGKISLPMLNDVPAAGMTPEQLADSVEKAATKFVREPDATVMVKDIRSRRVYVSGEVARPGMFPLGNEMTVMQALAEAGGPLEHANKSEIFVVRMENGQERRYRFNYTEYVRGRNVTQNIRLLPGDTILVR
jgi:polysaccharide export outer membrane protein